MSPKKSYRKDSKSGALRISTEEQGEEEDRTNAAASYVMDYEEGPETPVAAQRSSKEGSGGDGYLGVGSEGDNDAASEQSSVGTYPPVSEDEAETRKVEENLARWEQAERLRRKAAREGVTSTGSIPARSSIIADVTRRASLLWGGRNSPNVSRADYATHAQLASRESLDALPMNDMDGDSSRQPSRSLTLTPSPNPSIIRESSEGDPFVNPSGSLSPFADPQTPSSPFMDPSSSTPEFEKSIDAANGKSADNPPDRPILRATSLSASSRPIPPSTPRPLGLPPPKTPPPPLQTPNSATVFQPTPPPVISRSKVQQDVEVDTRWWHEWLCGCGEERGTDKQAGRTNPFE